MSRRFPDSQNCEGYEKEKEKVEDNAKVIAKEVKKLVDYVCKNLDEAVCNAHDLLRKQVITNTELEQGILDVSTQLYYLVQGQETLGIHEDLARSVRSEVYHNIKLNADGTAQDRLSKAESATALNNVVITIYSRAYKTIKAKSEAGNEVLASMKKILSARIAELEMDKGVPVGMRGSNKQ